ncbi:MAG: hypothetical protein SWQ30_15935 [Thermodesulfobacteriota bacterium]|nr:hypothetical protein [Thermodesulfobacteriota bacterium]
MSSKPTKISEKARKKCHSPGFPGKYPREIRELVDLSAENIPDEMKNYYPTSEEGISYCVTRESPITGFDHHIEFDLYETVPDFNSILMYRLLGLMYGLPDIVGAFLDITEPENPKKARGDWSYTLRLGRNILAEIRSRNMNVRHVLRYRTDMEPDENPTEHSDVIIQFHEDLTKAVSNNLHLFSEKEDFGKSISPAFAGIENSFVVKYRAAKELFDLAQTIDKRPQRELLQWDENPEVRTVGSIYMASALFYVIALESLLNLFYVIFLPDEYKCYTYQRVTTKGDLEIRLSTIHLFCSCFERQAVPPKSDLWEKMSLLRSFRNDLVHGNISFEHQVHDTIEDGFRFYYSPLVDFRGRAEEDKWQKSIPRVMSAIDGEAVERIKGIVDDLIQSLLEAMDEESRLWVKSWLYEIVVPPRGTGST